MADTFDMANKRLRYDELLSPDPGFQLAFAVCMTYSLDLEAVLGVTMSLGLLQEIDTDLQNNPFALLEAIRKSSDKVAIFCNAGSIALPQNIKSVFALLEHSVFEVKMPNRQNFHPKLWFIKYENSSGAAYIKLIVLTRNLTFDQSIDMCVSMQGKVTRTMGRKNQPLADMLAFVERFADSTKKQKIEALAEDLLHVKEFELSHPFEDYTFYPLGIEGHAEAARALFDRKYALFLVSPFLSNDIVGELVGSTSKVILVTRKVSVTKEVFHRFQDVYVTKEILNDNEFNTRQDIHAKLYYTSAAEGNFLYIGSANASHNAFHKNVEFLLRLKYKPNTVGWDTFCNDFLPKENCAYEKLDAVPERQAADESQIAIDVAFKEAVYAIKNATVEEAGNCYTVTINAKPRKAALPVTIAPLQRHALSVPLQTQTVLEGLLLKELSEFYILTIEGQNTVVKIKTAGIPAQRDDAIYNSVIPTQSAFLSYLTFMLSADDTESLIDDAATLDGLDDPADMSRSAPPFTAVYELMLKTLCQNPRRIEGIADMIKRLDPAIISDALIAMVQQFQAAARRLKA